MKELLLQTRRLLRGHPLLWLPVLWAAVLSYFWTQLGTTVVHALLPWMMTTHSVLGGVVPATTPARVAASYAVSFLGKSSCQYADACCFVAALLMTAKMVGRLTAKDPERVPYADLSVANSAAGVLTLGLLAYLLAYATMVLVLAPSVYFLQRVHGLTGTNQRRFPILAAAFMYVMLAYLLSPAAVRLLRVAREKTLTAGEISAARRCSLWAGAAMTLLSAVQILAPVPVENTLTERVLAAIFWSMVVALPYAPLFVALSLVAAGDEPIRGSFPFCHAKGRG